MNIVNSKRDILLTVTEEEACILNDALGRYEGPYSPDQLPGLNDEEVERRLRLIRSGAEMLGAIQAELYERAYG